MAKPIVPRFYSGAPVESSRGIGPHTDSEILPAAPGSSYLNALADPESSESYGWVQQFPLRASCLLPQSAVPIPLKPPEPAKQFCDSCVDVVPFVLHERLWTEDKHRPSKSLLDISQLPVCRGRSHENFGTELKDVQNFDIGCAEVGLFPSVPSYKDFLVPRKRIGDVHKLSQRARVRCGIVKPASLINSTVNWCFSGGTLTYLPTSDNSGIIVGAVGFRRAVRIPIQITSERIELRIATADQTLKTTPGSLIYQITSQEYSGAGALIGVRCGDSCFLIPDTTFTNSESKIELRIKRARGVFSHMRLSPYQRGEVLTSAQDGSVCLWNVNSPVDVPICEITRSTPGSAVISPLRHGWHGCYFGSGGRQAVVLTHRCVQLWDIRARGYASIGVLARSDCYGDPLTATHLENDIVAGRTFPDSRSFYHLIASTREICIVDQRHMKRAVLRHPSPVPSHTLFLDLIVQATASSDVVLTASQMGQACAGYELTPSQRVTGPLALASLPFCITPPRNAVGLLSAACDEAKTAAAAMRLKRPLTGMTGIPHGNGDGFSVVMQTALGDIFVQSYRNSTLDKQADSVADASVTYGSKAWPEQRQPSAAARRKIHSWQQNPDIIVRKTAKDKLLLRCYPSAPDVAGGAGGDDAWMLPRSRGLLHLSSRPPAGPVLMDTGDEQSDGADD
ncbi:uncharacterized protein LOC129585623 [Paramacrobiotus metropolitanus]|uniref:uncharacterized protein LOC129585623 n=1 Tax=Paramacrobiotus metropolitanus TaxID=2943436 RepID=UPI00244658EF|nr:uncharacterized protein LOC129585623 [Paramacrobiotus metropolitanus]